MTLAVFAIVLGFAAKEVQIPAAGSHVPTPAGLWPTECVHRVPSGTAIKRSADGGVDYHYPDGSKGHRAKCASSSGGPPRPPHSNAANGNSSTLAGGYSSHAYPIIFWGTQVTVQKLTATYNVPKPPASNVGQVIFWWFGVEPTSASDVLQPVLGWNGFNEPRWTFASWNCCPGGHTHYAPPLNVSEGDTIFGALDGTGGDGYEIVSTWQGQQSVLRSNDEIPQVMPLLAMETYNVGGSAHCDLLPRGPLRMTNVQTTPSVSSWGTDEPNGWSLAKECGWTVSIVDNDLIATPPQSHSSGLELP